MAIFPTYSEDDDNGSIAYSDPELDSTELDAQDETDEEEDYDSNPLYIVLSTSLSPRLKNAYDSAKLVLLPTRRALPLDMPRKLPDPNLQFESEWEQWIAAHTFVSASTEADHSGSTTSLVKDSKEGIEWVGNTSTSDRKIDLYLKPGTGLAEVRLTYSQPTSVLGNSNLSDSIQNVQSPLDSTTPSDFLSNSSSVDGDPHRTIRSKVGAGISDPQSHSSTFEASLTSLPLNDPTLPGVSIHRAAHTSQGVSVVSSPNVVHPDIIRSPSTATESSMAFTQSSSGVSRASSEGWSDMPVTPPNLITSMAPPPRVGMCKSHLSTPLVESSLDEKSVVSLEPALTTPYMNPISLPPSTVTKVRMAKIVSEETMYRSPSVSSSMSQRPSTQGSGSTSQQASNTTGNAHLESALSGSKAKKGKEVEQRLRFKAPKWLRPGAAQREKDRERERREKAAAVATARMREEQDRELSLMMRTGSKLERLRLISLKSPVIECWWQSPITPDEQLAQVPSTQQPEACEKCKVAETEPRGVGIFPFPRVRTSTVISCTDHRRSANLSSTSLSQRSTLSSTYHSQSMGRRPSSILVADDDRSSLRSSTRRESNKRRSRRMPSGLSILKHSGNSKYRSVVNDFTFLLSPPEEFGAIVCGILRKSVSKVWMHCHRFCETVFFLKGFEALIVSQLKNEIFEPLTLDVREDLKKHGHATVDAWVNEDWDRLIHLIENVLFAFLHATLYSRGISCHYASEDDYLDGILHNYRQRQIPLSEFAIELPSALQDESLLSEAVDKLNQLRAYEGAYTTPSPMSPEILQRLFVAMDTVDEQRVLNVLMAKTPLECISIIKQTIDILVLIWNDISAQAGMDDEARRLTPDDLLALLASVIVRSGVQQQHSLIQYIKVFRLSGSLSAETDWAFVSYQAAIAYLQSDPFSVLDSRSIQSQAGSVRSMPPHSPSLAATWVRRRPVSFTPPTTSSNTVTISARSSPSCSRLSLTEPAQPCTAPPSTSNPYAHAHSLYPQRPSRGHFLARSHHPTSSLALGDPPSVRLEITSARHDHSRSVDCLHAPSDGLHKASCRKLVNTRPILSPINTADRSSRRIDGAMLSAPMIDGGYGRSCSNPWDSSRSLGSIGEVVTDPSSGTSTRQSESPDPSTMKKVSASSQGISIHNHSFHHPFSDDFEVQGITASSGTNEKGSSPILSRRKTVDWAGTFLTQSNTFKEAREDLKRSDGSQAHSHPGSMTASTDFGGAMIGQDGPESDLRIPRCRTGSSLSQYSSIQEPGLNQQASEGWLEWGRKRLTSVTSLNVVSGAGGRPADNHHRAHPSNLTHYTGRRGSSSSVTAPTGRMMMNSTSLKTDSLNFSLNSSHHSNDFSTYQRHHSSSLSSSTMTPAMEALNRARTISNLNQANYHSLYSSTSSRHSQSMTPSHDLSTTNTSSSNPPGEDCHGSSGSPRTRHHHQTGSQLGRDHSGNGMIPLRPMMRSSTPQLLFSQSIGPSSSSSSSSSTLTSPDLGLNRSTSSLHTLH